MTNSQAKLDFYSSWRNMYTLTNLLIDLFCYDAINPYNTFHVTDTLSI